ncbi:MULTISPECIES: acylphosphatase [unclassified Pseudomonas]|jgi:acylphosphatase|uniref:acylphosphatase n=1 Tax=unclassified Pseudomonas TaxID=196821 RepID=UPI000DABA221|nr:MULTISPECIES: acylphosphatase [unclassified Pseudomonas]PZW47525.1 acylphosphatase [Pseudomonas sp. URMO17WK12:I2]CAH0217770.1 Acylphosphatase [Pseudomonas sp. Bi70]
MAIVGRHGYVEGRVQGVGFRQSTAVEARRLQLSGWVRNLPDGRVEISFEGEEGAVHSLAQWLEHGPSGARVVSLTLRERPVQDAPGFEIRR